MRVMRVWAASLALLTIAGGTAAAQTPPAGTAAPAAPATPRAGTPAAGAGTTTAAAATTPADEGYVLGAGDVIEVGVIGRPDYTSRVRIQTDGTVQLPLIEKVKASDHTTLSLADDIRGKLASGGYFAKPAVTVEIVSYVTRYITVLGEVAQPGLVPIDRPYRVSEIVARVGGVKDNGSDTLMLRHEDGTEQELSLQSLAVGDAKVDPMVQPGDKLYVPVAKTYYIYGQVPAPGNYKLERAMTLRMAIARGGGLTPSGSEKRTKVYRNGALVAGVGLNDQLQAGDVVVVGERFF